MVSSRSRNTSRQESSSPSSDRTVSYIKNERVDSNRQNHQPTCNKNDEKPDSYNRRSDHYELNRKDSFNNKSDIDDVLDNSSRARETDSYSSYSKGSFEVNSKDNDAHPEIKHRSTHWVRDDDFSQRNKSETRECNSKHPSRFNREDRVEISYHRNDNFADKRKSSTPDRSSRCKRERVDWDDKGRSITRVGKEEDTFGTLENHSNNCREKDRKIVPESCSKHTSKTNRDRSRTSRWDNHPANRRFESHAKTSSKYHKSIKETESKWKPDSKGFLGSNRDQIDEDLDIKPNISDTKYEPKVSNTKSKSYEQSRFDYNDLEYGSRIGVAGSNIIGYKSTPPNNTILIKGLPLNINDADIYLDVVKSGFSAKDIRVIRKSSTGVSRGFAFVEFHSVADAIEWMEEKEGVLTINDAKGLMQFAIKQDSGPDDVNRPKHVSDWFCIKCSGRNFSRRNACYQCNASVNESMVGGVGSDEASDHVTNVLLLRNLDVITTEMSIFNALKQLVPQLVRNITGIVLAKDPVTNMSYGFCYLSTDCISNAAELLQAIWTNLKIDDRNVIATYCKRDRNEINNKCWIPCVAKAETISNQKNSDRDSVERKAVQAAKFYATSSNAFQYHLDFYRDYYSKESQQDHLYDQTDCIPNGTDGKTYPVPDPTKFVQIATTGFSYDPKTGLMYHPMTKYYWNSQIEKYLYWDVEKMTYLIGKSKNAKKHHAPPDNASESESKWTDSQTTSFHNRKKIIKDMERWEKRRNKTECAKSSKSEVTDLHFDQTKPTPAFTSFIIKVKAPAAKLTIESASQQVTENDKIINEPVEKGVKSSLLDFNRLICLLCKRQLASVELLKQHELKSELHKNNLLKL